MYQELRSLNVDSIDVDQIVALLAFAKAYKAEFDANSIETPAWVDDKIRALKRELQIRHADQTDRRLKELRSQRDSLLTAAEKRAKLDEEISKLEQAKVGVS